MSKALVIDDSTAFLKNIEMQLERGLPELEVVKAYDGKQGIELAKSEKPDVILLDLIMPVMDGLETCERLKNDDETKWIPIIMMTGMRSEDGPLAPALEVGADGYLYKPFAHQEMIALVKVMLRIKRTEDALRAREASLLEEVDVRTEELKISNDLLSVRGQLIERSITQQTQELIQKERLAQVGILAAGIAHEINNPTTFISSNIQTFKMYWKYIEDALSACECPSIKENERIDKIIFGMPNIISGMENGVSRISSIVSQIKNYSSKESANFRFVSLKEVVDSAVQLTWNQIKHHLKLAKELPEDLPSVYGSAQMLSQVVVNLLMNAAEAFKEKQVYGEVTIKAELDDKKVVMWVRDNGPGMDQESLSKIFDPFFTTRRGAGGTGLGLFVSYGIVNGHNGELSVESELGQGTCFTIKLPVAEKE